MQNQDLNRIVDLIKFYLLEFIIILSNSLYKGDQNR